MAQSRPSLMQRLDAVAAEPERETGFVRGAERVVEAADRFDGAKALEEVVARSPKDQHHAAVVAERTPEEIVFVGADRWRQAQGEPKKSTAAASP
jgi:hypothetical protein